MSHRYLLHNLLIFIFFLAAGASQAGAAQLTVGVTSVVEPGAVVVWSGKGISECRLGKRSWHPASADQCIFPVDMLHKNAPMRLERVSASGLENRTVQVGAYPYDVQHIQLKDNSKVSLSPADLDRVGRENREIRALWPLESTGFTLALPFAHPLSDAPAGGRFGSRRIINGQPRNPHSGADYGAPQGTPVLAVADGVVALTGDHFFAGNSVFLDHGNGLITMYFHLHEIKVKQGQTIRRGQTIATVGATGRATGPHLHFGVRWHGKRINPDYLFQSLSDLPRLN